MNIVYLHRLVCEELDGAREYIMKACHIKDEEPAFAKTFVLMSSEELEHGKKIYEMIGTMVKEMKADCSEDACKILDDLYEVITDDFDERYNMVKNLHSDYDR